jgi:hypothetical protein
MIASHVRYDGLEQKDRAYSMIIDNQQTKFASSLSELLFKELELKIEDALLEAIEPVKRQSCLVYEREVISGNREEFQTGVF